MKISKSKQELASIISENGGWRDGARFAWYGNQTKKGWFGISKPLYSPKQKSLRIHTDELVGEFPSSKVANWHQTILSREEYFHLYQDPDAYGWIEWNGGECPVDAGTMVVCKVRTGKLWRDGKAIAAGVLRWSDTDSSTDIISYRLHNPEQAKPRFCESVMRSIPEYEIHSKNMDITQVDDINVVESKTTIEQLAADYRNLLDFARRKQQEADDAKADADARLKALELAGEALGLLVSPINANQESELVIEVRVGDEVECVESNIKRDKYNGMVGTVLDVDDSSTPYLVNFGGCERIWCHKVKFIRRP